jgi:WD40 repeat protein
MKQKLQKSLILAGFLFLVGIANSQKSELMIQTGHQSYVQNISLSPDETKVITVDADGIGILWDMTNNKKLHIFQNIRDAQFATDGLSLFLVYEKGEFKNVDLSGNVIKQYSTSGEKSRPELAKYYKEAGLIFYRTQVTNVNTGKITQMAVEKYGFNAMLYAPLKGQVVWSGKTSTANIYFFDVNNGNIAKTLKLDLGMYHDPDNLSISQDNNTLLVSSYQKANVLDFNSGNVLKIIDPKGIYSDILFSSISPNGKNALLVMKSGLMMVDVETQKTIWEKPCNNYDYSKGIFNFNGDKVYIIHNGGIEILNTQTGRSINAIKAIPLTYLLGMQIENNKTQLFTLGSNKYVINWNLATGRMEKPISFDSERNGIEYAIKHDGKEMIFADFSYPKSRIAQIKLENSTQISQYPQVDAGESIKNISLSFDNHYLLSSRLLTDEKDGSNYPKSLSVYDVNTHNKILDLPASGGGGAFANTKNRIVTKNGWNNGNLNIYDVPSGQLLNQITFPGNISDHDPLLFSPSDKYLATSYNGEYIIYELASQKFIKFRDRTSVGVTSFTPDEKYFLTGSSWDGCVYFYDLQSQQYESVFKMKVTGTEVKGVSFSKDGKFMYTSDADNTIKVWNFETKTLLATLYTFPNSGDWAVLTPDGHFDGTDGAQKNMYYVKGVNTISLEDVYEKFYVPKLLMRLLAGEQLGPIDVDINTIHPRPKVSIKYTEKSRNLSVVSDNPVYSNETGVAEITVNATAENDKVDEIRLFHNGKVVNLATRNLFVTDNTAGNSTKTYTINLLAGVNTIRALALNSQRTESKADEIVINYKTSGTAPKSAMESMNVSNDEAISPVDKNATLYLIVVGINKYKNPKMSLNYALADATAFKNEAEKGARTEITNVKTYFITDEKADKIGIRSAFDEVQKLAHAEDVFVFYYAGHGVISEKNKDFYLVPNDVTDLNNVDAALDLNGIPAKTLQKYAIDIAAQKQLFILDACQSAGAFATLLADNSNQQKSLSVVARSTGTHWIAASGSQQFANEFSQLGHGAFTYVLLKAMAGEAAKNKMITVNGLKIFLQSGVPDLMKKYNGTPQYPASYGFGSDFPVEVIKQ